MPYCMYIIMREIFNVLLHVTHRDDGKYYGNVWKCVRLRPNKRLDLLQVDSNCIGKIVARRARARARRTTF